VCLITPCHAPPLLLLLLLSRGKSTLMRLLARRQLPVSDSLDILLVEQEVVGSDMSALEVCLCGGVSKAVVVCVRGRSVEH
jgi:hypothetical protein